MQILYECLVCTREVGIIEMIRSFKDKETEKVFQGRFSKRIPPSIAEIALKKLMTIHAAGRLYDLILPPSNHLEKLLGDREGFWSIRINNQWRIAFRPIDDGKNYEDVHIVDYH